MQGLYRMNKKYLYELKITQSQQVGGTLYTPLLNTPHNKRRKNYCKKLWHVVASYVRVHPIRFTFEILVVGLLSYLVEHMAGSICLFKHGRLNIQHYSEHFYFLAGSELRMSTEFTR